MGKNSILDDTTKKYFSFSTKKITHKFINSQIKSIIKNNPKIILDIGCGNGYTTNIFRENIPSLIIGCDINGQRIKNGKTLYGGEFILANINYLPFKSKSVDTVVASEVLEHLNDIDKPVTELRRVTQSTIIITVPNDPLFMIANFLRGRHLKTFGNPYDHINHFNAQSLSRILSKYFFDINIKKSQLLWLIVEIRV